MTLAPILRLIVDALTFPVIVALLAAAALTVLELGVAVGERFGGLARLRKKADPKRIESIARNRIGRADVLARTGPMLGLMGTLIPLGPGLAGLGEGDVAVLAQAVTVAFDTTVMGLFAGAIAFAIARVRRRWYEELLDEIETSHA